ncbi:helix-turn-helix domain-containing protein [Agrilactobacillus yilanensis]|uniref:Helix-turn-helix domain-containing protein n=1 Tax=Agrilactobacillus yilanensis TaxID=2485997 RepID=A0ABW4JAY6_9LACO|nr:helix-turn-helix domain-containing protein [Agrilactobacillus yilanensis]
MDLSTEQINYYQNLIEYLSMIQGKNSDIVLTDLTEANFPILMIKNGSILDVRKSDDTPELVRERIEKALQSGTDQFHEQFNLKHKTLNMSVTILEAPSMGKVAISVITDATPFITALRANANLAKLYQLNTDIINNISSEVSMARRNSKIEDMSFADKIHEMVREKIDQVVLSYGIDQDNFKAQDRRNIVSQLLDEGVFNMKYSVVDVARALGVSEPTIYRYIQELKESKRFGY